MAVIIRPRRGTAWESERSWAKAPFSWSDFAYPGRELIGIRLVRDQHQEHFTPKLVSVPTQ